MSELGQKAGKIDAGVKAERVEIAGGAGAGADEEVGKVGRGKKLLRMSCANPCILTIIFNWLFDPTIGTHKGEDSGCVDLRGGIIKTDLCFECFLTPLQLEVVFKLRCLNSYWLKRSMLLFEHSPYSNRLVLSLTEKTLEGDFEADYFKQKRTLTLMMRTEAPPNVETEVIPELADFILSLNARIKKVEDETDARWESPETFIYPVLPPRIALMNQIRESGSFTRPTKDDETGKLHDGNRVEFSHATFLVDSAPPPPPLPSSPLAQSLTWPLPLSSVARMLCNYQGELLEKSPPSAKTYTSSLRPANHLGTDEENYLQGQLDQSYKEHTCTIELPHLRRIFSLFSIIAANENRRRAELITSIKASDLEHTQWRFDIDLKNMLSRETLYMCRQSPKEVGSETLWLSLDFLQQEEGNGQGHKNGSGGGNCSVM